MLCLFNVVTKMVFKLIRTDVDHPNSNTTVQLCVGTQFIGRGVHCTDKRVSRNHGELIVTDDLVTIKALHQNPCFFVKKGTEQIDILRQNCTKELTVGDKIGLLPDSYWYELTNCDINDEISNILGTNENIKEEKVDCDSSNNDDTLWPVSINKGIVNNNPDSPSLIPNNTLEGTDSPTQDYDINDPIKVEITEDTKQGKRSHSTESNSSDEVKKIKIEAPDDTEAQPGPSSSNHQSNNEDSPDTNNKDKNDDVSAPSPAKPANRGPGRERCIYGANCYRKDLRRRVSYNQLQILWYLLQANKDLLTGYNKTTQARALARKMWQRAAVTLNANGDGATKDWTGWNKYWNDYKAKLKVKVTAARASRLQSEGGPPNEVNLTDIEYKFLSLLGDGFGSGLPGATVEPLDKAINQPQKTSGSEMSQNIPVDFIIIPSQDIDTPGPSKEGKRLSEPNEPAISSPAPLLLSPSPDSPGSTSSEVFASPRTSPLPGSHSQAPRTLPSPGPFRDGRRTRRAPPTMTMATARRRLVEISNRRALLEERRTRAEERRVQAEERRAQTEERRAQAEERRVRIHELHLELMKDVVEEMKEIKNILRTRLP